MKYWLLKSEPASFSITDLQNRPRQTEHWDGVRNYQARNYLRKMSKGDLAFFYHSSCEVPGIVGVVEIVTPAYPDFTARDPESDHFDPRSTEDDPRWFMVDVKLQRRFTQPVTLSVLRQRGELENLALLKRGNRLSVMPLTPAEWRFILKLA